MSSSRSTDKVRFFRPNPLFHRYLSACGNYVVDQVEKPEGGMEDFAWMAWYQNHPLADRPFLTRGDAFAACHEHEYPRPARLTIREHRILSHLIECGGTSTYKPIINDGAAGLKPAVALAVVRGLVRRELLSEQDINLTITTKGELAVRYYVVKTTPDARSTAQLRRHGVEERPTDYPVPTKVQWWQAKVDEYRAKLLQRKYAIGVHPFSDQARYRLQRIEEILKEYQQKLHAAMMEQEKAIVEGRPIPKVSHHAPL